MPEETGFQISKLSELIGKAGAAEERRAAVEGTKFVPILPAENKVLQYVMDHRETLLGILQHTLQGLAEAAITPEVPTDTEGSINTDLIARLRWMTDYIIEEKFPEPHLKALKTIISLFNYNKDSEKEIFDFVGHLTARYGGKE